MCQILFDFYAAGRERDREAHVFSRKFFFREIKKILGNLKIIMDVNGNSTLSIEELKKWLIGRVADDDDVVMGKEYALEK